MRKEQPIELGDERSLFVHQEGRGPDLVMIHGAVTTSHDWLNSPVHRALARSHRVTVIDRPGHGLSRRPRFGGSPRCQADQIAEGLAQAGVARALFVAHSFGSLVALALAERHPALAAELILIAPIAFPEPRPVEHGLFAPRSAPWFGPLFSSFAEFSQLDRPMIELVHEMMFSPASVPKPWKTSYPWGQILSAEAMVSGGEDSVSILPLSPAGTIDMQRINAPARIITGTADRVVEDERQGKLLARRLPKARLIEVDGAGHMLHHSHADIIVDAIEQAFVSGLA